MPKLVSLPIRWRTFDDMQSRFDAVSALDRRTELVKQYRAVHAVHAEAR